RVSLLTTATLHPGFGAARESPRAVIPGRAMIFAAVAPDHPSPGPCEALEGHPEAAADARGLPMLEAVKRKVRQSASPGDHCRRTRSPLDARRGTDTVCSGEWPAPTRPRPFSFPRAIASSPPNRRAGPGVATP